MPSITDAGSMEAPGEAPSVTRDSVVRSAIVQRVPSYVSNASARQSAACGARTRNATSSERWPRARRSTTSLNPG